MRKSAVRLAVAALAVAGVAAIPATAAMASSNGHYAGGAPPAAAAKPMANEWTASAGNDAPGGTRVTTVVPAGQHEGDAGPGGRAR